MKHLAAVAALFALVSCSRPDPVADEANNVDSLPTLNQAKPTATGAPPANTAASDPAAPSGASIPAALQGRWGLSPGDCTSTRGDAKGLLVVSADHLQFYESRAVPAGKTQSSPNSINGDFAFTGEGQSWSKYESLELQGDKLVRTERNPIASFNYVRCR